MLQKIKFLCCSLCLVQISIAQIAKALVDEGNINNSKLTIENKRSLTHKDYDRWESIGERAISNNGAFVMFVVNKQEGDGNLYIKTFDNKQKTVIERGYSALFTNDNNFVIGKIKPTFAATREAKIKKKRPDEMPKDSFFIYNIVTDSLQKIAKVKNFKIAEKGAGYIAYLLEKADPAKSKTGVIPDSLTQINNVLRMADSLRKMADSLVMKTKEAKEKGLNALMPPKKDTKAAAKVDEVIEEGTDLVLIQTETGKEKTFKLVNEYYFDKNGNKLLIETSKKNGDSTKKAMVLWHNLATNVTDTIFAGFNDAKNYAIDEFAEQIAFVVEKDSTTKALQKFYQLYYYAQKQKTADKILTHKDGSLKEQKLTISPDFNNYFSKDGEKLFFGLAPIRKPKDTTLVDFETARLDIWNYKDDYLQPQQLLQTPQELRRSYTAVIFPKDDNIFIKLGTDTTENIQPINEGNANYMLATSNYGNRIAGQWSGFTKQSAYILYADELTTITKQPTTVFKNERAFAAASPMGKYVIWYNWDKKCYFTHAIETGKKVNISQKIKTSIWDEEDDHPDAPPPHGIMRWSENDKWVYIYDKYDIWQCDPNGIVAPLLITNGRKNKIVTRFVNTDVEDRFLKNDKKYLYTFFSTESKKMDIEVVNINDLKEVELPTLSTTFRGFVRAKDNHNTLLYTCENPKESPYILSYVKNTTEINKFSVEILHQPNAQQDSIIWYNTELVNWKMFDGKISEGILYKPENFDPNKKYPIIFYFYERDADDLYNYKTPAPSASTINIPWFTSNGYLVFDPNIYYKNGEPGESAYNSVVSAAKYLSRKYKWVDSTKMAIQGQSWGGYQVAYLVTRTNIFACASAGAPVSNMTSAYGGIRWGSGVTRQFQYESGQTRIGKTLWDGKDLYLKNSPLFAVPKVNTPLLLMHNDKDGAVPWYQSIEFFTALKRNNKKTWLLQYNDEDHNLIERRNRKDLSIRLGQFFDHYLKGKPMPKWMSEGVPAVEKGIEWGL